MDAALGVGRLLNITKDRGKISSLCWLLSMNPKARLHCSSLWFSNNILSIVQRHFRHCRDQHLVKLPLCKTIIWKSLQSSATGFENSSPSTEPSLSAMPLLVCSPFTWGNTEAHLKGGGENWLLLLLADWKERCFS